MKFTLMRTANRLAVAFITSSLVIGTSIIMSLAEGPEVWGVNVFQIFGIGAIIGGGAILITILRDKPWKKR